jgi:hypothetical protein
MRQPSYLSHSSVSLWYKDREEFYVRHLCDHRLPKTPQQNFMAIGSGFDARVKSELHTALFGPGSDPQFEFQSIFEDQVEDHNRDWCIENSWYVFKSYKASGAYDELLQLLQQSDTPPRFEFTVHGELAGVPFLGKPDCRFTLSGHPVILDWKVRGYCSNSAQSPTKFYRLCRDGYVGKQSKSHRKSHPQFLAEQFHGLEIHAGALEDGEPDYADQLAAYSWLMGERVGGEFVGCIDEIVAKPADPFPLLRVANHRARIRPDYQRALLKRITDCWAAITTGHIFTDRTKEESDERCKELDQIAISLSGDDDDFFHQITKSGYR